MLNGIKDATERKALEIRLKEVLIAVSSQFFMKELADKFPGKEGPLMVYYMYFTIGLLSEREFFKVAGELGYEVGTAGEAKTAGRPVPKMDAVLSYMKANTAAWNTIFLEELEAEIALNKDLAALATAAPNIKTTLAAEVATNGPEAVKKFLNSLPQDPEVQKLAKAAGKSLPRVLEASLRKVIDSIASTLPKEDIQALRVLAAKFAGAGNDFEIMQKLAKMGYETGKNEKEVKLVQIDKFLPKMQKDIAQYI